MFLKEIEIENFKGIKNLKIEDFGKINIFTGENSSGKTTVLESICAIVGESPVNNIIWTNGIRQPQYFLDIEHCFFKYSTEIIIKAVFTENYSRNAVIIKKILTEGIGHELLTEILEKLNGQKKLLKFKKTIKNGGNPNEFNEENLNPLFEKPKIFSCVFPNFKTFEHSEYNERLASIIKNKEESNIIGLLSSVDENINGITLIGNSIYISKIGLNKLLPIELCGDGLRRILSLFLAINKAGKGGIVVIDEIENGMHFKTMPKLWNGLINAAIEMDVQLFITTHNEELLEVFANVLEEKHQDFQHKIRYYNLKKYKDDKIVAYKYDFEKFDFLISNGNEIR